MSAFQQPRILGKQPEVLYLPGSRSSNHVHDRDCPPTGGR